MILSIATAADPVPSPESEAYETVLLELLPKVKQAMDTKSPISPKRQPLLDFTDGKAQTSNHPFALQTLLASEKLLGSLPAVATVGTNPAMPMPMPSNKFVNHAKTRLARQAMRQKLVVDLKSLQQAILDHHRGEPDLMTSPSGSANSTPSWTRWTRN